MCSLCENQRFWYAIHKILPDTYCLENESYLRKTSRCFQGRADVFVWLMKFACSFFQQEF